MKKSILIILLLSFNQITYSQPCGQYHLRIIGEVIDTIHPIQAIELPTISNLHGSRKVKKQFTKVELKESNFELTMSSFLTSYLYTDPGRYLKLYQSKNKTFPIRLFILKGKKRKIISIELSWEDIEIKRVEDDLPNRMFELNLGTIQL